MFRYHKINEDDKKETIILYDLKNKHKKQSFKNKEQELVHKEEKDLNKKKYYKIEDKKLEYLEKSFKQIKTKIKLGFDLTRLSRQRVQFLPEFIFDVKKIGENKKIIILYDKKYCSKLIEIETSGIIFFVEKLGNGDLVFLVHNIKEKESEILIYREIKDEKKGYYLTDSVCKLEKLNERISNNVEEEIVYTVQKGDVPSIIASKNSGPSILFSLNKSNLFKNISIPSSSIILSL